MQDRQSSMKRIIDLAEKLFVALIAAPFLISFAKVLPTHPYFVLLTVMEGLTVVLVLTRRSGQVSTRPFDILIALVGTAAPLMARPTGATLVPQWVSAPLMLLGVLISIAAKLSLNRSFGLVAANRGVKQRGPYRWVRHPMYLGYITTQVGFLLASFSALNALVYLAAWTMQALRIREEERVLLQDPAYRAFAERVPDRLVPIAGLRRAVTGRRV